MLKRIVTLLKIRITARQQTPDLFARRFCDDHTDQHQWNGGRLLSAKEVQDIKHKYSKPAGNNVS